MKIGRVGIFVYNIFYFIWRYLIMTPISWIWYFPNIVRLAIADAMRGNEEPDAAKGEYPDKVLTTSRAGEPTGVIFGKNVYDNKFISKPESEDGHVAVFGTTSSHKTSGVVIPTLLSWTGRVVVFDPKGELYKKTAWKRPSARVFNPMDKEKGSGFNPFYVVDRAKNKVDAVRAIALALIPTDPKQETVWTEGAQNLLTAAILHFHSLGLSFIETMIAIRSQPLNLLLEEIERSTDKNAKIYNSQFTDPEGRRMVTSYYSLMCNAITVFATDDDLIEAFSKDDCITPLDLEHGHDIYISFPESKLKRWKPAMRLIAALLFEHEENKDEDKITFPTLYLLEECARFGKIDALLSALATLRSKRITLMMVFQSIAQIDEIYGASARKTIIDNCDYRLIMRVTEGETQEYFSKSVGDYEKEEISESEDVEGSLGIKTSENMKRRLTRSKREARIIRPQLFGHDNFIPVLLCKYGLIRAKKTPYFDYGMFKMRSLESIYNYSPHARVAVEPDSAVFKNPIITEPVLEMAETPTVPVNQLSIENDVDYDKISKVDVTVVLVVIGFIVMGLIMGGNNPIQASNISYVAEATIYDPVTGQEMNLEQAMVALQNEREKSADPTPVQRAVITAAPKNLAPKAQTNNSTLKFHSGSARDITSYLDLTVGIMDGVVEYIGIESEIIDSGWGGAGGWSGVKVKSPEHFQRFLGRSLPLETYDEADIISGATISSKAFIDAINQAYYEYLRD